MLKSSKIKNSVASKLFVPNVNVANGIKWGLGWGIQDTDPYSSFWHRDNLKLGIFYAAKSSSVLYSNAKVADEVAAAVKMAAITAAGRTNKVHGQRSEVKGSKLLPRSFHL